MNLKHTLRELEVFLDNFSIKGSDCNTFPVFHVTLFLADAATFRSQSVTRGKTCCYMGKLNSAESDDAIHTVVFRVRTPCSLKVAQKF